MPVSFDAEQLAQLKKTMLEKAPPFPVSADLDVAATVVSIATAGAPIGMLMNAQTDKGPLKLYFNPVVAVQLLQALFACDREIGWWDKDLELIPKPKND